MSIFEKPIFKSPLGRSLAFSAAIHAVVLANMKESRNDVINVIQPTLGRQYVDMNFGVESKTSTNSNVPEVSLVPHVKDLAVDDVMNTLPINKVKQETVSADEFVGPQFIPKTDEMSIEDKQMREQAEKVKQYFTENYAERLWDDYEGLITDESVKTSVTSRMLIDYIIYKYLSELAITDGLGAELLKEMELTIKNQVTSKIFNYLKNFRGNMNVSDIVVTLNRILISTKYGKSQSGLANYLLGREDAVNCEARAILTSIIANKRYSKIFGVGWEFVIQASGIPHVRTVLVSHRSNSYYPIDGSYVRGKEKDYEGVLFERGILELLTGRHSSKETGLTPDESTYTSSILDKVAFSKRIISTQVQDTIVTREERKELEKDKAKLKPAKRKKRSRKSKRRARRSRMKQPVFMDVNDFLSNQIEIAKATGVKIIDINKFPNLKLKGNVNIHDFTIFHGVKVIGLETLYKNNVVFKPNSLTGLPELVSDGWNFSKIALDLQSLNPNVKYAQPVDMFQRVVVSPDQYLEFLKEGIDVSKFTVDISSFKSEQETIQFAEMLNHNNISFIALVGHVKSNINFTSFKGIVKPAISWKEYTVKYNNVQYPTLIAFSAIVQSIRIKNESHSENSMNMKTLIIESFQLGFLERLVSFSKQIKNTEIKIIASENEETNKLILEAGFELVPKI